MSQHENSLNQPQDGPRFEADDHQDSPLEHPEPTKSPSQNEETDPPVPSPESEKPWLDEDGKLYLQTASQLLLCVFIGCVATWLIFALGGREFTNPMKYPENFQVGTKFGKGGAGREKEQQKKAEEEKIKEQEELISKEKTKENPNKQPKTEPKKEPKTEPKKEPKKKPKTQPKKEPKTEPKNAQKKEQKTEPKKEENREKKPEETKQKKRKEQASKSQSNMTPSLELAVQEFIFDKKMSPEYLDYAEDYLANLVAQNYAKMPEETLLRYVKLHLERKHQEKKAKSR